MTDLDILRAWLSGTPLSQLPAGAEDVVRREASETVVTLMRDLDWLTREMHEEGGRQLDKSSAHEFMRGYGLGLGRGLQRAATAVGHVMNAAQRRGLR